MNRDHRKQHVLGVGERGRVRPVDLEIILRVETWALVQTGDANRK